MTGRAASARAVGTLARAMATAPSPPRRPAAAQTAWLRALPAVVTVTVIAVAMKLLYAPWYMNYDARYSLLWASDVFNGFKPEYKADFAPTPHPLQTLASAPALLLGDNGDLLMTWVVLICFGVLAWLVFRLGSELFSPWVGAVTALVVITRPLLERDAALAYQDIPFAMLVVLAVLLEARRPRRGLPVLAVLAVAGLLRPEAWVLGGLYWLWLWPVLETRRRALYAVLVAAAPVIWSMTDLIVTGDPLHSLHGTADLAIANDRRRTLDQVPLWTAKYLGSTLREAPLIGLVIGLAFAWRHRRRQAVLPLAVVGAMLLVFAVGPIFGLPLIGRYVRTPAILLALFYGLAVAGWTRLPKGRERTAWLAAGVVALALSAVFLPGQLSRIDNNRDRLQRDGLLYDDLKSVARAPRVKAAFAACAPMSGGRPPADPVPARLARRRARLGRDAGARQEPARADPRPAAPGRARPALLPRRAADDAAAGGVDADPPQRDVAGLRGPGCRVPPAG
jgi:hypothetical protein